jgi:hypothetical protein
MMKRAEAALLKAADKITFELPPSNGAKDPHEGGERLDD